MTALKVKMRFDYPGQIKSNKLFGGKKPEQLAEAIREDNVAIMRNVPMQGIRIVDIDMSQDVYSLTDELSGKRIAYAPVTVTVVADGVGELVKFVAQEEFRTVQVIEPEELSLSASDLEKVLFKVSQELRGYREYLLRKIEKWK